MKTLFGKLFASALFAGALAISAPAFAANAGQATNILCYTLQSAVNSLLNVGQPALLEQATKLVVQMVNIGCPVDMIPAIPALPLQ